MKYKTRSFHLWAICLVLASLLIVTLSSYVASINAPSLAYTEQSSFYLKLSDPQFDFMQSTYYNTTGYIEYEAAGNDTQYFLIPKDATVTSASFNLTGSIKTLKNSIGTSGSDNNNPIMAQSTTLSSVDLGEIRTDITGHEIVVTSNIDVSTVNTIFMANNIGAVQWAKKSSTSPYPTNDVDIGSFITVGHNDIVVGGNYGIYDYNYLGTLIFSYAKNNVVSVKLGDLVGDSSNELVYGTSDGGVFLINTSSLSGEYYCTYSTGSVINSVDIADIDEDSNNEILVGSGTHVYILDSSCGLEWSYDTGTYTVKSVAYGDLTVDSGLEVVLGTTGSSDGKYYLLDSTGSKLWDNTTQDGVFSVVVGEFDSNNAGPEIIGVGGGGEIGNKRGFLNLVDKNGYIYWAYSPATGTEVNAVGLDNIIYSDTGSNLNEVVIGTKGTTKSNGYNLFILNYDTFPTNVTIDIGGDGIVEWVYDVGDNRLRDSVLVTEPAILSAIDSYIQSTCTASDLCAIPVKIGSDVSGILDVSFEVEYTYDSSDLLTYDTIRYWSKTDGLRVDEAVVSNPLNITYANLPLNLQVKYISISPAATTCGFEVDSDTYGYTDYSGTRYCDISSRSPTYTFTANQRISEILWDNTMIWEIPVTKTEYAQYITTGENNYYWRKNLTITSENPYSSQTFDHVWANTTINDSVGAVKAEEFLNVNWSGTICDIMPASSSSNCNQSAVVPSNTYSCNGGLFRICKQDTNGNGIIDFVKWVQPNFGPNGTVFYQVGGSPNMMPELNNMNVSPASNIWGSYFNYSVNITDDEGDFVNVSLYVYSGLDHSWVMRETKNVTGQGLVWFNILLDKNLASSSNKYGFYYGDNDESYSPIHFREFTANQTGPTVYRHNITVDHISGNDTMIIRDGNNSILRVRINDTELNEFITESGVTCTFSVTKNHRTYAESYETSVNESGYCTYNIEPDSTYEIGPQYWKVTVDTRYYVTPLVVSNWTVNIMGKLNLSLETPTENQVIERNSPTTYTAHLINQYGNPIDYRTIDTSSYNCSWYFNDAYIGSSVINDGGYCNYTYTPGCAYTTLGDYPLEVYLNYTAPPYNYTVVDEDSGTTVQLVDSLSIDTTSPLDDAAYFKGEIITLTSSISDSCGTTGSNQRNISWYVGLDEIIININETQGLSRNNTPIVISGSDLVTANKKLDNWLANSTQVTCNGTLVPNLVTDIESGHLKNTSNIVFLLNFTPYQNISCVITSDTPDVSGTYSTSYVRNGGFEGQTSDYWTSDATIEEIEGLKGNYSSKLYCYYQTSPKTMTQTFAPLTERNIKIWYSHTDVYAPGLAGVNITIGDYEYALPIVYSSGNQADSAWRTRTISDDSIIGATNITITLYSSDSDGGSYSGFYLDHICVADDSGNCISDDYGDITTNVISKTLISTSESTDSAWTIPLDSTVGTKRLTAIARGLNYHSATDGASVEVSGFMNISEFSYESTDCDGSFCYKGAQVDLECHIVDANTTSPLYNASVRFYRNETLMNAESIYTDENGIAEYTWDTSLLAGVYDVKCNITDDSKVYYNVTYPAQVSTLINVFTEATIGNLSFIDGSSYLDEIDILAENITKAHARRINVTVFINNTGDTIMSSPHIIAYNTSNITVESGRYNALSYLGSLTTNITVVVPIYAPAGITPLDVSLQWTNNATPFINQTMNIDVTNTTYLNIHEPGPLNYAIPYGGTKVVGNFTIEAYGNTPLDGINITLQGLDYEQIRNWTISFSDNYFDIERYGNRTIFVTVSVPSNSSLMGENYQVYIVSDAENSSCIYAYDQCSDRILLNLSVMDQDWHVMPLEGISKTVGLGGNRMVGSFDERMNITNLENYTLTLNISIVNETDYMRFMNITYIFNNSATVLNNENQTFNISALSSGYLNVDYDITNATNDDVGDITLNVSYHNLYASAVPIDMVRPVTLSISSLNVEILDPTTFSPATDIVSGNILNFTLNVTRNSHILNDTVNTSFTINISSIECPLIDIVFNESDNLWYLNCTAPLIPGNPVNNSVSARVDYRTYVSNLTYTKEEPGLVIYRDVTSPVVNRITLNSVRLSPTTEANMRYEDSIPYVYMVMNITDNVDVTNAWMELTDPTGNTTYYSLNQSEVTPAIWSANYTNLTNTIGDYRLNIHATDGLENHTINYTAWFDVYRRITITDNFRDAVGTPISAVFDLYKPDTDWVMHRFSTASNGDYSWSVHKRLYDLKVTALGQSVTLNSFDINQSAVNQTGNSNPSSLTDAISIHLIPNSTTQNASNIDLPSTAEYVLMAFVFDTPDMTYSNATVTLHYSEAALSVWGGDQESDIRVFYCSDWNRTSFICESGEFEAFNNSATPDVSSNTITFTTTHNSAYALARWCGGECNPTDDGDGSGSSTSSSSGSSGSGGGTVTSGPVCGDGSCDSGENAENCPSDCSYHVCGNGICEATENKENCPLDCYSEPFEYETDFNFMELELEKGKNATYSLTVRNSLDVAKNFTFAVSGDITDFIEIRNTTVEIAPNTSALIPVYLSVPSTAAVGTYSGSIDIKSGSTLKKVSVSLKVVSSSYGGEISRLEAKIMTKNVLPTEKLRFNVMIYALDLKNELEVRMKYDIKDSRTDEILKSEEKTYMITKSENFAEAIDLSDIEELPNGEYYLEVTADYGSTLTATDTFEVVQSFFATTRGKMAIGSVLLIALAYLMYLGYNRYKIWRQSKARYVFPMDYSKLPDAVNPFVVGKIAETNKPANYNPNDLTTHALVTGSTGAGKSVAASILIEEALKQKIPVIVFDPTAQWTGFVRPCKDSNLLKYYPEFGMNPEDARPFPGMIYEVTDPHVKIDIKKYMNPGEITVFTLNHLKPGEYDQAVEAIIDTIFQITWEESPDLKMIVVFDEVHRLLEKYGGKGGYVALEKACREFRKWGIGMLMSSQVYSDFKEAIQGNILTEIQLNTKSLSDISKIKEKYGEVYSEKISRQGIGVGMIQNPRYNDGKPWFIHFRPTLHSPHKITDEELKQYNEYADKLSKIEKSIEKLKKKGVSVMDFELELKLASSKLKQGHFKMAEIYINSLMSHKMISDNFS